MDIFKALSKITGSLLSSFVSVNNNITTCFHHQSCTRNNAMNASHKTFFFLFFTLLFSFCKHLISIDIVIPPWFVLKFFILLSHPTTPLALPNLGFKKAVKPQGGALSA